MVLSEEKMKTAVPNEEQKSYGAETNNRAVFSYSTVDQLVQSKQVSPEINTIVVIPIT